MKGSMTEWQAWKQFEKSGTVADYMHYLEVRNSVPPEWEQTNADQNAGTGFETTEYRGK